jgi:PAS domain S-box-containing protein
MNVTAAISVLATAVSLALGFYVISRAPRQRLNRVFFLATIALTIWGIGEIVSLAAHSPSGVLLGRHIAFVGWCFIGPLFLQVALEFSKHESLSSNRWFQAALYSPFVLLVVLDFTTRAGFHSVAMSGSGYKTSIGWVWYLTYGLLIALMLTGIVVLVLYRHKTSNREERARTDFVIIAALIPLVGSLITEWLIPYKGIRPPVNSFTLVIVMAAIIAYAVSRRGLMSTLVAAMGGTVVSIMNDPVVVLDSTGSIESVNAAAVELTGYSESELQGTTLARLFPGIGRGRRIVSDIEDGRDVNLGSDTINKNGLRIPVTVVSGHIRNRRNRVIGSVVILHDMRDAMDLARAQERTEAQTKYSQDLKDIIDIAAHELRHPATVLKGYAKMLLSSWDRLDEATIRETLLSFNSAANRISRLSVDLLDASLMGTGDMELSYTLFDPMDIVADATMETRERGARNEMIVTSQNGKEQIRADRDRLQAVLSILLDNAVKFWHGEVIDITLEKNGLDTVFSVADRGLGIPEEHRDNVFERFYQVEDAKHHSLPGMGLGLYIAKSIIDAHGGWIRVEDRDKGGSVFVFGIPSPPAVA